MFGAGVKRRILKSPFRGTRLGFSANPFTLLELRGDVDFLVLRSHVLASLKTLSKQKMNLRVEPCQNLYAADASPCAVPLRGRDVLVQDVLPTTALRYDVAVSEFQKYLRFRDIHGLEELVNHGLNQSGHLCIQHLRTCFASKSFGRDKRHSHL